MSHRPEIELLIACALPPSHPQIGERIRASAGGVIDWNKLRQLAAFHRVQPLLCQRLAQHAKTFVPEYVLADLDACYRAGATGNLNLTRELISLSKAFAASLEGAAVKVGRYPAILFCRTKAWKFLRNSATLTSAGTLLRMHLSAASLA